LSDRSQGRLLGGIKHQHLQGLVVAGDAADGW
jgi:hypothetical protein